MMVFVYEDLSVRVVVSTANLVSSDWENRTQGLWVSPRLVIQWSEPLGFDREPIAPVPGFPSTNYIDP